MQETVQTFFHGPAYSQEKSAVSERKRNSSGMSVYCTDLSELLRESRCHKNIQVLLDFMFLENKTKIS